MARGRDGTRRTLGARPAPVGVGVLVLALTLLSGAAHASTPGAHPRPTSPAHAAATSAVRAAKAAHAPARRVRRTAAVATALASNPLAGRPWGVYKGNADQSWPPYVRANGTTKDLLAKISLRPKAKWFGSWISNADIARKVHDYIANSQAGNPSALVQMTIFRMVPWEHDACRRLPTLAEQTSYRQWISRFAQAVGSTHTAIILQPDGPFALCVPHGSLVPSHLIRYAAKTLSALPDTSVYIDGGASDWPANDPAKSAQFLVPAGIAYTRGFALDSTHYVSTASDIEFGTRLVGELARRGAPGKHFVINTSSNGKPFTFNLARGGGSPDNAKVCATKTETVCVTLGIPPTTDVANSRWGLSSTNEAHAKQYVDGYLWFGRPWLYMQADPFDLQRALSLARTTPY